MSEKSVQILDQMIANNSGIIRDGKKILCKLCNYEMDKHLSQKLKSHLKTAKHLANSKLDRDLNDLDNFVNKDEFCKDLTKTLINSGMPFETVDKKEFREFFQKHLGKRLPCSSTLRLNYTNKVYQDNLNKLINHINGYNIYIQLDETQIKKYELP